MLCAEKTQRRADGDFASLTWKNQKLKLGESGKAWD
jgi:hypothetical protein